jgi:hypothetical protein
MSRTYGEFNRSRRFAYYSDGGFHYYRVDFATERNIEPDHLRPFVVVDSKRVHYKTPEVAEDFRLNIFNFYECRDLGRLRFKDLPDFAKLAFSGIDA